MVKLINFGLNIEIKIGCEKDNASAGLAIMTVKGGNDLIIGLTRLAGFIALAVINIGMFIYIRFIAVSFETVYNDSIQVT